MCFAMLHEPSVLVTRAGINVPRLGYWQSCGGMFELGTSFIAPYTVVLYRYCTVPRGLGAGGQHDCTFPKYSDPGQYHLASRLS